jgi:hypothetical protein
MNPLDHQRLRGLQALFEDAVEHGSAAVERVHRETLRRPFEIVAAIPPIEEPARALQAIHELALTGVYRAIRLVNRWLGGGLAFALERAAASARREGKGS